MNIHCELELAAHESGDCRFWKNTQTMRCYDHIIANRFQLLYELTHLSGSIHANIHCFSLALLGESLFLHSSLDLAGWRLNYSPSCLGSTQSSSFLTFPRHYKSPTTTEHMLKSKHGAKRPCVRNLLGTHEPFLVLLHHTLSHLQTVLFWKGRFVQFFGSIAWQRDIAMKCMTAPSKGKMQLIIISAWRRN